MKNEIRNVSGSVPLKSSLFNSSFPKELMELKTCNGEHKNQRTSHSLRFLQ